MKKLLLAATVLAATVPALATDVAVSVQIGDPHFYGRIDIGNFPRPAVIYAEPVIIHRPVRVVAQPLYLRVPPGHAKKWSKHCARYDACGRQVYFVRDEWYNDVYAPKVRGHGGHGHDKDHDNGHGKGHGKDKGGHGKGKGHD